MKSDLTLHDFFINVSCLELEILSKLYWPDVNIYINAFGNCFYPKQLKMTSRYKFDQLMHYLGIDPMTLVLEPDALLFKIQKCFSTVTGHENVPINLAKL